MRRFVHWMVVLLLTGGVASEAVSVGDRVVLGKVEEVVNRSKVVLSQDFLGKLRQSIEYGLVHDAKVGVLRRGKLEKPYFIFRPTIYSISQNPGRREGECEAGVGIEIERIDRKNVVWVQTTWGRGRSVGLDLCVGNAFWEAFEGIHREHLAPYLPTAELREMIPGMQSIFETLVGGG